MRCCWRMMCGGLLTGLMAVSTVSGQEVVTESVQEGNVTVTVEAKEVAEEATASEGDEAAAETDEGKVKSSTSVTSTITIVSVDDEGNVVKKTFTIDGTGAEAKQNAAAAGVSVDVKEVGGKGKLTLKLPNGTVKNLDLGTGDLLGGGIIELQVEDKGENKEGGQARVMRLQAQQLSEQVRKSLESIGPNGGIDPEEISEQIRAAMSEALAGQEEGMKLMRLGRAIVLEGKDIGDQAVRRYEFRADRDTKENDSSSSAILEKLEAIMKRMDKIEADIAELKQAKE